MIRLSTKHISNRRNRLLAVATRKEQASETSKITTKIAKKLLQLSFV